MADDFENFNEPEAKIPSANPMEGNAGAQPLGRVRVPRGREVIGKVDQRVGANRMIVSCFDGKQRNCRVPGRHKRELWIRPGNIVLVEPWEFEGDKKGDIIFSYTPTAIQWLERKGFLKGFKDDF
jgi:translation initiation factor 1A